MKCTCGNKINTYRTTGVILAHDEREEIEHELFMMRLGSLYRAMVMTECSQCGKIEFYNQDAACIKDLVQLPNDPVMEDFEEKYKNNK
jgi:hypothetical protein